MGNIEITDEGEGSTLRQVSVCLCVVCFVCVYACVCVRERERERENLSSCLKQGKHLDAVCELLGLEVVRFGEAVCQRAISVGHETLTKPETAGDNDDDDDDDDDDEEEFITESNNREARY